MDEETGQRTCAHDVCNCAAAEGSDFCGPYCQETKPTETVKLCDCGHPTCFQG